MSMQHYAHAHTFVGMAGCVRLKVRRGSLAFVYAETARKQSDGENRSPEHLWVSCLSQSLRSKALEQI